MNQHSRDYWETLKSSAEILAVCLGVSYAVGFIVVNSYLINLGTIEFELFKLRYITCGLLVLFIIGLFSSVCLPRLLVDDSNLTIYFEQLAIALSGLIFTSSVMLVVVLFVSEKGFLATTSKITSLTSFGKYLLYTSGILFLVTNALEEVKKFRKLARYTNIVASLSFAIHLYLISKTQLKYLILWGLGYFFLLFILFAPTDKSGDPEVKPRDSSMFILKYNWGRIGLAAWLFLFLLIAFGNYLYPHMNPAIGGGKAVSATLIPLEDKATEFGKLLPSNKVFIVDQTSSYYYVLHDDQKDRKQLVQINKAIISGIIFNPTLAETDSVTH